MTAAEVQALLDRVMRVVMAYTKITTILLVAVAVLELLVLLL